MGISTMFFNVEHKLKFVAKVNFICAAIIAVIILIIGAMMDTEVLLISLIIAAVYLLLQLILSWFIYAFAELLENAKEMNQSLKVGFAQDISAENAKREKAEVERKAAEEKARQAQIEAERAKQARILAYWRAHPEEKKALTDKRTAAEEKLKEVGGLAGEQRKQLQNLIRAIDEELTKDRES